MSAPAPTHFEVPCCSPATTESVAVVRDKIGDSRADILVGQGHILKTQGDYTSAILRDANANTLGLTSTADRNAFAAMSQIDKYGLANLNASNSVSDNVTRSGFNGVAATHDTGDKLEVQANTIAWNQAGLQNAGFSESRAQVERINDAQSAYSDRTFKSLSNDIGGSFARLSAQGENGFYRTGQAVAAADKQVVQSEIGLTRTTTAGFADSIRAGTDSFARLSSQADNGFSRQLAASIENGKQTVQSEMGVTRAVGGGFSDLTNRVTDSYARLSEQNCDLKSAIAAAQAAAAECCCEVKQEVLRTGKELGLQAAGNFGAIQVEAAKNKADVQLQAAVNQKEGLLEQSKWFALAEKTAMINKCELEAKLAACCCEVKELVTGTASATQALIQAGETTRIRDALSAAATENAILKLRREEHHYHPYHHHGGSRRGSRS